MSRINKFSPDKKVEIINMYLNGVKSVSQIIFEYEISKGLLHLWLNKYKKYGIEIFENKKHNKSYSKDLKTIVVQEYLEGLDTFEGLALKYSIPSYTTIIKWVKDYNNHIELKDYDPKGDVYMVERRRLSVEERIKIVEHCLKHQSEYKITAELYNVSYAQVYQWVKKYEQKGPDGLLDQRGKRKSEENLSEVEKLQKKIEVLEKQLKLKEMENTLLKKVKEFERRRYLVKFDKKRNT